MAGPGETSSNLTFWLARERADDPLVNLGPDIDKYPEVLEP